MGNAATRPTRKVTESLRARFDLTAAEIEYWNSLTSGEQEQHYSAALADIRFSVLQENAYGKRGQRGNYGPGCSLAQAINVAFSSSPQELARHRAEDERRRAERGATLHVCCECGRRAPERYALVCGDVAQCFPCCRRLGTLPGLVPAETADEREALKTAREATA